MKILICIKQVPELEALTNSAGGALDLTGLEDKPQRMSRYDEYAVETAMQLREAAPVERIDALTVGPPLAVEVVKRALGMGADHGIRIDLTRQAIQSPYVTAGAIADYAARQRYDLILCGVLSEDLMQGQVGPALATLLDLPWAGAVLEVASEVEDGRLEIVREADGGRRETLQIPLPALLTVQTGGCTPRYPSLSNLLRANRQPIETIIADPDSLPAARLRNVHFTASTKTRHCVMLDGSPREKARELAGILRIKGFWGARR